MQLARSRLARHVLRHGSRRSKGWMRPLPTQPSDEEEGYDEPIPLESVRSREHHSPDTTVVTETLQAQAAQLVKLQKKAAEMENALAAIRVHHENACSSERAARVKLSHLLDEACDVFQRELGAERQARRDAIAALRVELTAAVAQPFI